MTSAEVGAMVEQMDAIANALDRPQSAASTAPEGWPASVQMSAPPASPAPLSKTPSKAADPLMGGLTILRAHKGRATKVHTRQPEGGWATRGYDRLFSFSVETLTLNGIDDLWRELVRASTDPRALVVGEVGKPGRDARNILRRVRGADADLCAPLDGVRWVCWEVDHVKDVPADLDPRLHTDRDGAFVDWWVRAHLPAPFHGRSVVLQWSASALVGGKLSMHLWQWLDRPVARASIRAYAMLHLRSTLDVTVWDSARVHYVADPIFVGEGGESLPDPLKGRRWQLIQGEAGDTCEALPEWVDEMAWAEWTYRKDEELAAQRLTADAERARLAAEAAAARSARGGGGSSGGDVGDESGELRPISQLDLHILDPKRVLAWARAAVEQGRAWIAGAVSGDAVEGRHQNIRAAGLFAGNILEGLERMGAALSAETEARVSWSSGVADVEAAVRGLEVAAIEAGGNDPDRARVFNWAVETGRGNPSLPDYRLPMKWRPGAKTTAAAAPKKTEKTEKVQVLPAYGGQPAVEVEVDGETGEVKTQPDWTQRFRRTKHGNPTGSAVNLELIALNDPAFGGVKWNEVAARMEIWGRPAWARDAVDGTAIEDAHVGEMKLWVSHKYECPVSTETAWEMVSVLGKRNAYDPLRDYLRSLKWDGTPRIFHAAVTHLHAQDTPAARKAVGWWLMAAARRALEPGCQSDYVLTLEGRQGLSKSQLLRRLVPSREHMMIFQGDPASPKAIESIRGKWLIELAELSVLGRGRDMRIVKGFITTEADDYRAPWARAPKQYLRRCAFLATVNPEGEGGYLADSTGNRRWWPVKVLQPIDLDAVERDRDQLWAEAVARLDQGERHWPTQEEELELFAPEQRKREDEDVWADLVLDWASAKGAVTTLGVLEGAVGIPAERITRSDQNRVGAILQRLGWTPVKGVKAGQVIDGSPVMKGSSRLDNKRWWRSPEKGGEGKEEGGTEDGGTPF